MKKTAIALGFFDGVHLGHRTILQAAIDGAAQDGLEPVALTFDTQPRAYFSGLPGEYLTTREEKIAEMQHMGIRRVDVLSFADWCGCPPETFVREHLVRELGAGLLVCGDDYRFGARAAGTPALLRQLGEELGFRVVVCAPVEQDGLRISSSRLREALQCGRMQEVTACLGRDYTITGPVCHGKGLGRQLGFATLNVARDPALIRPRLGVYAALALVDGVLWPAAVNIGVRPTFDDGDGLTVEAHLTGFSGDVYGRTVTLYLKHFIRDERKFDTAEALQAQVDMDLREVERVCRI